MAKSAARNANDPAAGAAAGPASTHPQIPTTLTANNNTRTQEQNAQIAEALRRETAPTETPAAKPATEPAAASRGSNGTKMAIIAAAVLGGGALIGGIVAVSGGGDNAADELTGQASGGAAIAVDDSDDGEETGGVDTPGQLSSVEPETSVAPDETNGNTGPTDTASSDTAPSDTAPPDADTDTVDAVGERYGRYADGKLTLIGPVPDQETADRLAASAADVIGADNVTNEYVIDPSAPAVSDGLVIVDDPVLFNAGSTEINPEFFPLLDLGVIVLTLNSEASIRVVGHTDNAGDAEANVKLSQQRAQIVADYIIDRGIDASRLETVGAGESEPRESNDTEAGRAANRRIDVEILNLIN